MKTTLLLFLFLTMQSSGWAKEPRKRSIQTTQQAVAVVRRDIRAKGGNPAREEMTATGDGRSGWHVTSWHIVDSSAVGGSRFVPGGYTEYTVSVDGHITKATSGL